MLIICCEIKFEDFRMRESLRDHVGKKGLVAHSGLLRHKKIDRSEVKRACCVIPQVDGTQGSKADLRELYIARRAIKEDKEFELVSNIFVVPDRTRSCSSNVLHIISFDTVKFHGLRLLNSAHNESQDGKTEEYSMLCHFKQQTHKNYHLYKLEVHKPNDIANATEHGGGLANSRFDAQFDRP